ncbi:MAG: DMT family transporter [Bacillota bacterium]
MLALILAAAAGISMAIQGAMNGALGRIIGMLEGNFLVHAIGLAAVAILLFAIGLGKGDLAKLTEVPWYLYLGGVINVAIIFGVMVSIDKIGAGNATTAIIAGQLAMALIIDACGLFGLDKTGMTWGRGVGLVMMAVAAKLLLVK